MRSINCAWAGVLWLLLTPAIPFAAAPDLVKVLATLYPEKSRETLGKPYPVELSDHTRAETVVFRRTRWELKSIPQSADLSMRMERAAMQLAESERLKVMNRIDDHEQVWTVDLKQFPGAGSTIKALLKPLELPHESFRELVYLGQDGALAWYGHLPIYEWVQVQKRLKLLDGDDPLAAAIRGLMVEDRGSMTANSVPDILIAAGDGALPYLKTGIESTNFWRFVSVLSAIKAPAAEQYLVDLAGGPRAEVARVARHYLQFNYRPSALPLYLKWLDEDSGRGDVYYLLACLAGKNPEPLRPYLPRIMGSPATFREFRLAFETARHLEGAKIPEALLELEKDIRMFGYRSGTNFDQHKVNTLANKLVQAGDTAAAAVIAVDLAVSVTKGDWTPINKAGMDVISRLPGGQGTKLLEQLQTNCRDKDFQQRLERARKL